MPEEVKEAWTKLLEILEDRNRILNNVEQGSVLLTLFCPNPGAQQQLQSEEWIQNMRQCLTQLLNAIGKSSHTGEYPKHWQQLPIHLNCQRPA